MIYIEGEDGQFGMKVSTRLGQAIEMCLGQEILEYLERNKVVIPSSMNCPRIKIDFKGARLTNGIMGAEDIAGNFVLLENIISALHNYNKIVMDEVSEHFDGYKLNYEYSSLGFLFQEGKMFKIIVDES